MLRKSLLFLVFLCVSFILTSGEGGSAPQEKVANDDKICVDNESNNGECDASATLAVDEEDYEYYEDDDEEEFYDENEEDEEDEDYDEEDIYSYEEDYEEDDDEYEIEEEEDSDGSINYWSREYWTTEHKNQNRTIFDLWFNLKCDVLFEKERPIPTTQQFEDAIELYNDIFEDEEELQIDLNEKGFYVPVEVKHVPMKGRGLFATKDIKKGEVVRKEVRVGRFYDARDYREFVLNLEVDFACDVLQWAYTILDADEYYVGVDLDEASICNDGGENDANVVLVTDEEFKKAHMEEGDKWYLYEVAARDIKAGEELLCLYKEFDRLNGWEQLGLE